MNYKGKKVKIINTEDFIRDDYKDLDKYINQTGVVRWDFEGSGHRLSIKFDDKVMDNINDNNRRLCFRVNSVEFIDDTYEKPVEKGNKILDVKDIKIDQKYKVIENRNTYYGSCDDIIEIEGQEVEVYGINENNEGDISIKSKDGVRHACEAKNLELIEEEDQIVEQIEQVKSKSTNKVYK